MPDAGDPGTRNAPAAPINWGDAFAALPGETPPAGGWQRLQARMPAPPARRARNRWPLWLATAASLGLVVALPVRIARDSGMQPVAPLVAAAQPVGPSPSAGADTPGAGNRDAGATAARDAGAILPLPTARSTRKRPDAPAVAPAHRPVRTLAEPAGTTRLAESDPPARRLESLHAESARLEHLLSLVRDDRVASGASVALSSDFDDRVAGIDAALVEPGLDASDRDRLWQERVDALQQLVGIETTSRLLSARGESFNASLVSVD